MSSAFAFSGLALAAVNKTSTVSYWIFKPMAIYALCTAVAGGAATAVEVFGRFSDLVGSEISICRT